MGNSLAVAPNKILLRRPQSRTSSSALPLEASSELSSASSATSVPPDNVHLRVVTELLTTVQESEAARGNLSAEEEAALNTAIQVLRSDRLRRGVAAATGLPPDLAAALGPDYTVQPFYDSAEEQRALLRQVARNNSARQKEKTRHRKTQSDTGDYAFLLANDQQHSRHHRGSRTGVRNFDANQTTDAFQSSASQQGRTTLSNPRAQFHKQHSSRSRHTHDFFSTSTSSVLGRDRSFTSRPSSASSTGTTGTTVVHVDSSDGIGTSSRGPEATMDVRFKEARKPTVFQRKDGTHEPVLVRGVSFDTHRTLRSLSMQGNNSQSVGRGPTGNSQLEFAGSLPAGGSSGSNRVPDFADYKCYIPRTVLEEIFAFSEQSMASVGGGNDDDDDDDVTAHTSGAGSTDDKGGKVFTATEAFERPYEAAVLFADMSGFTALTERLASRANNDGAELLCAALNNFFGVILDIVEEYGGDCVKFAGDAICVLWTVQRPDDASQQTDSSTPAGSKPRRRRSSIGLDTIAASINRQRKQDNASTSAHVNPWRNVFTLEHATVAAAACSAAIHRRLRNYPRAHGVKLTVHMGLGCGHVKMLYVGGKFGRWEFVVAGDPMKQIAIAEPLAGAGETVCSPEAWQWLAPYFAGVEAAGEDATPPHGGAQQHDDAHVHVAAETPQKSTNSPGNNSQSKSRFMVVQAPWTEAFAAVVQRIHATAAAAMAEDAAVVADQVEQLYSGGGGGGGGGRGRRAAQQQQQQQQKQKSAPPPSSARYSPSVHLNIGLARSFIPNAIYQQLAAGYSSNHLVAEMREISVVFVKVSGLSVHAPGEHVLSDMQQMMLAVQESTYLFEGSINKLLIDDKGLLVVIGFGLPPLAHEDDPLRAVAAACELRHRLSFAVDSPGLTTHVGITTGEIFCGVVGNHVRREYTVMGDLVNLSARLMGTAGPNSILVDETTAMRCVRHVQFHTVPPLQVKGKVRPVQPFTPDGWFTKSTHMGDGLSNPQSAASSRMMSEPHVLGDDGTGRQCASRLHLEGMNPSTSATANSDDGESVKLNRFFKHILKKSQTIRDNSSSSSQHLPGGYNGDRVAPPRAVVAANQVAAAAADEHASDHNAAATNGNNGAASGSAAIARVTHVYGRTKFIHKIHHSLQCSSTGDILAVIGETGIGKSAFLAKAVAHLSPVSDYVVVGVDFGDTTGHLQHLPDTASAAAPWCTRMTEVGILSSFQDWKSAILQAIANYLYNRPTLSGEQTVLEAYTQAIVDLVPRSLRRHIYLIDPLFPELHLRSSKAVAEAVGAHATDPSGPPEGELTKNRRVELRCRILIGILRSAAPGKTLIVVLDSCRSFDAFSWTLLGLFSQLQHEDHGECDDNAKDVASNASPVDVSARNAPNSTLSASETVPRTAGRCNSPESSPRKKQEHPFHRSRMRRHNSGGDDDKEAGAPTTLLLPHGGKVVVVVMSRPMSATSHKYRDFAWMVQRAAQASSLIHLGALERKYCEDMVFRALEAQRVPEEVLDFIAVHSHGNPLHLLELCRHLLAEQLVFVLNGECRFSSPAARQALVQSRAELQGDVVSYPRVLVQNARSRLDHLRPPEQMIVKIASVLPRFFRLWQLLFVVNDTGREHRRRGGPVQFQFDVQSSMYRSLEQLVLSGILVALKGTGNEVIDRAAAGEEVERFDEYELDLPLDADCVLTFHSATIRACASTLLLSTQRVQIRDTVQAQLATPLDRLDAVEDNGSAPSGASQAW